MSPRPPSFSPEERDRLRALLSLGASIDQAAKALGRSPSPCRKWAIRMGLTPLRTSRAWSAEEDGILTALHARGATKEEMAGAIDRSPEAIKFRRRLLDLADPVARSAQAPKPRAEPAPRARLDPWDSWQAANNNLRRATCRN
jgi:hypothetical protein